MKYARFRADPEKVRVSIGYHRKVGACIATVSSREPFGGVARQAHEDPELAVLLALKQARRLGMPGIDLDLTWSYAHPWPEFFDREKATAADPWSDQDFD